MGLMMKDQLRKMPTAGGGFLSISICMLHYRPDNCYSPASGLQACDGCWGTSGFQHALAATIKAARRVNWWLPLQWCWHLLPAAQSLWVHRPQKKPSAIGCPQVPSQLQYPVVQWAIAIATTITTITITIIITIIIVVITITIIIIIVMMIITIKTKPTTVLISTKTLSLPWGSGTCDTSQLSSDKPVLSITYTMVQLEFMYSVHIWWFTVSYVQWVYGQ